MSKLDNCGPFLNPYTAFINDVNVMDHGALVESFKVSGSPIVNNFFQGRNRTSFAELAYSIGMKTITLSLVLAASTRRQLTMHKSVLDALMVGKIELHMPDGFYYTAVLQASGDLEMIGVEDNELIAKCSYTFSGIQHDALQTVEGNTLVAAGTMPRMDCILSCTTSQAYPSIQVGQVTFKNVASGAVLVADGINGRILVNNTPAAQTAEFTRLPYLVPGEQTITCPETLTVQYYPAWI